MLIACTFIKKNKNIQFLINREQTLTVIHQIHYIC
jgi:hypothetical protein